MDLAAARLATSPAALALLATMPPYEPAGALALASRLRAGGADPDVVAAAMTQARLRAGAASKFGPFANGMLFTQDGLEQATRLAVAAHHAKRYLDAGFQSVADLTCGLGADSMAFASLGLSVLAFEQDEATALFADHNLRHWERRTRGPRRRDGDAGIGRHRRGGPLRGPSTPGRPRQAA